MRLLAKLTLTLGCSAFVALAACGGAGDDSQFGSSGGPPGSGGFGNGTGAGGENGLGNGTATPPELEDCATSSAAAEPIPAFLVVMYDKSGSMDNDGKWDACKAAMKGFFSSNDSKGMNASLSFFPQGNNCNVGTFAAPSVAMTALPSNTLGQRLDQNNPNGGTPTRPALEGAVQYAQQSQQGQGKDGKVVIVLVTDGQPNDCSSSVGSVSQVAQNAAATFPTYVIGVGSALQNLDAIAQAGGTNKAFIVNTGNPSQTQQELTKALNDIRESALTCDYKIPPPPPGEELDKGKVNVTYTPNGTTAAETLSYNQSCQGGTGWRYDDPNNPTRILMCDGSCTTIKAKPGKVDVLFGCATKGGSVQ